MANFRGEASPKTWLYRIAANALRDFLKSKSHREDETRNLISERELKQYEVTAHGQASVEQNLMRDEMNACIREFIQRLPQNYGSVLVLSDLEGHSNQETAEILGVTLETVKIRLHRARARLKVELSQGCDISTTRDNELECLRKEPYA